MINEIPHFASVPASELALPFLSSAGIAAEDYEIPHPCIFTDFLNYMEHSVEHEQREYQDSLLSHINHEFLQDCPEAEQMMRSLGQSVFVPENWEGARIPALSLRFAPGGHPTRQAHFSQSEAICQRQARVRPSPQVPLRPQQLLPLVQPRRRP